MLDYKRLLLIFILFYRDLSRNPPQLRFHFPFRARDVRPENGAIFEQCVRSTVCQRCTFDAILATFRVFKRYFVSSPSECICCCRSLFSSFQQGTDDAGLAHRRSTNHNVRRFTGTAMLMSDKIPAECFSEISALVESREPSNASLRSRKSSHTSNR